MWTAVRYCAQLQITSYTSIPCLPESQFLSRFSTFLRIVWYAVTWKARFSITFLKTMNRSKFRRLSHTPCRSTFKAPTKQRPTFAIETS